MLHCASHGLLHAAGRVDCVTNVMQCTICVTILVAVCEPFSSPGAHQLQPTQIKIKKEPEIV